ncbi:MFS transporter [Xanthobacter sp. KR7-225]|uniref:MFS transporter n=1 Tax=Xanthobacter sp. KR7-225 TaxID=3156613 RepID=UPI0032B62019
MNYLYVLGLATFASAFSMRAIDPMVYKVAADLNITLGQVATLASAFTLAYASMQLVFGPIGDAVGKVRLVRINLAVLALGLAASALAPSHEVLFVARIVSGGFAGGIIPVVLATVGDRASFAERPVALSRVLFALILGQLLGSTASGFIAEWLGWRQVFWTACAVASLGCVGCTVFLSENSARERLSFTSALARYRLVLRNPLSLKLYGVAAVEGAVTFGIFPLVAALMVAHGLGNAVEAGLVIGAFALGGACYSLSVGLLVRFLGLRGMIATGGASVGVFFIGAALVPSLGMAAVAFAIAGFAFYMIHNVLQILATELAPEARGSGVALFASSFFTGQAIGAVVMAGVAERIGAEVVFLIAGVAMILLAWPASRLAPGPRRPPPASA